MNIAISVKQPWAYLLCAGIKPIENRTWPLPEKHKGERVFIHASAKPVGQYFNEGVFTADQLNYLIQSKKINLIEKVQLSAIIGSCRFVDCVVNHPSIWAEKSEVGQDEMTNEWFKPIYNWVVADPILFDEPILDVKGKLSFWDCTEYINREGVEI
ncbi:ASCH domain-containing protein [Dysgonomonas macrotermitis]|uniref:ASCH domain-containing protein n=1 Tax=Dysgonomonas macrotermitis TaxID=1346286 RepID=A0A1M5C680_9BACT|nr:ASCH domain-containing protein [Dysgonomonas macrotermitis]SHF50249.1 ASCH domain-containing protein [Dysgonomonas macrotermitis]